MKRIPSHKLTPNRQNFESKFILRGPDDCWQWIACTNKKGYGRITIGGKRGQSVGAHRVAYELAYGKFNRSLWVLHHCDNPGCVNPKHLFLGTNYDNVVDRQRKGRTLKGIDAYHSKLTEWQVSYARSSDASLRAIGNELGVSHTTIRYLRIRRSWKHIK